MADRTGIPPWLLDRLWLGSEIEEVAALKRINPFWGMWKLAAAVGLTAAGSPRALESILPAQEAIGEEMTDEQRMQALRSHGHSTGVVQRKPA